MNEYCEHKLKEKIKIHREMGGLEPLNDDIINSIIKLIFNGITEFGKYQITWKNDIPIKLQRIKDESKIEVMAGKYYIDNLKQLYSSEFIEFNIMEHREYQLNKIL